MMEQILRDVAAADPHWRIGLLRYFNPVGAHPCGTIGEDPHGMPNNLMPYIAQVAVGRREKLSSSAATTPPPTAPACATTSMSTTSPPGTSPPSTGSPTDDPVSTWNLGTGHGASVLELLHAFERACGRDLPYEIVARRPGDIAASYADPERANRELGWRATRTVDDMCVDTWRWQSRNPHGYPDA